MSHELFSILQQGKKNKDGHDRSLRKLLFSQKNVLDEVKAFAAKHQKQDQDVYDAYKFVHEVIEKLETLCTTLTQH